MRATTGRGQETLAHLDLLALAVSLVVLPDAVVVVALRRLVVAAPLPLPVRPVPLVPAAVVPRQHAVALHHAVLEVAFVDVAVGPRAAALAVGLAALVAPDVGGAVRQLVPLHEERHLVAHHAQLHATHGTLSAALRRYRRSSIRESAHLGAERLDLVAQPSLALHDRAQLRHLLLEFRHVRHPPRL